jgi:hypothetical protein
MGNNLCAACGQSFEQRPQSPQQAYCSAPSCQRERKRRWQRGRLQADPDYRDNQARAQRAWMDRNPDYWRIYREAHPKYVKRNRERQRARAKQTKSPDLAKIDVSKSKQPFPSGIYRLRQVVDSDVAKMDVWTVELTKLCATCPCSEDICKEMT